MFDIKCVGCKYYNPYEGWCEIDMDEEYGEGCERYEEETTDVCEFICSNCSWRIDGECIFDFESPIGCNRFKSLKESD